MQQNQSPAPVTNITPPQPAPKEQLKSKKSLWVILILMVLAIAVSAWYWQTQKSGKPVVYNHLPAGYKTQAPKAGSLPDGFPQELVLSIGQKQILRAEDTIVATGQNYKIVDVQTADQPESLAGLYRNALTDAKFGWQLVSSNTADGVTVLNFKKDSVIFTVTIIPKDSGSQMSLNYVVGK
ncbi:MAG: hypothetical protein WC794_06115 [Candidatus Doudnabacteria bacterium]|jgi:hypothetical protein